MSIRSTPSRRAPRAAALCLAIVSAVTLSGCGNFWSPVTTTTTTTTTTGNGGDFVYVAKTGNSKVAGYAISSSGLTPITGSPFSVPATPLSMVVTPSDSFLYVGTTNGIYGYSIGSGGVLTALNSSNAVGGVPANFSPAAMAITPDGNWLMVLNNVISEDLYFYAINTSTGILSTSPSQQAYSPITYNGGTAVAETIQFSPVYTANPQQYVFAASFGPGGISTYTFTPANSTPIVAATACASSSTSASVSDNGIAFNGTGTSLTVASGGSANNLISYTLNSTTTGLFLCTETTGIATTASNPTAIAFNSSVAADQNFIYAINSPGSGSGSISGFTVTSNSSVPVTTFAAAPLTPYSTLGSIPYAIGFDNTSTYMVALDQAGPSDLVLYTVSPVSSTSTTAGQLSITGAVSTGLVVATGSIPGVSLVTTH